MHSVMALQPDDCETLRETLRPWLQDAIAYDVAARSSPDALVDHMVSGQLMPIAITDEKRVKALCTAELVETNKGLALHIVTLVGEDQEEWLPQLLDVLETVALEQGCAVMACTGRPGWRRVLRKHGWREEQVTMMREVGR